MSKHRWVRTCLVNGIHGFEHDEFGKETAVEKEFVALVGLRSDGELYDVTADVRAKRTAGELRTLLDRYLDALSLGLPKALNFGKGKGNWVEERPQSYWLRTKWMPDTNHPTVEGARCSMLRALRDDGQPFAVWGNPGTFKTKEETREDLDTMLDNPALWFVEAADDRERAMYRAKWKGEPGWVEEPKP